MVVDITRVGPEGIWAEVVAERRQYIQDTARCVYCGLTRRSAQYIATLTLDDGVPDFCARRPGMGVCRYAEDTHMVNQLMREIMAGQVRTVAEAYPPPVQGPKLPEYAWLLDQKEWWYPHRRPAVRIASMDRPWRFNTVRFLERKAGTLHLAVIGRWMSGAPDEVWNAYERENPLTWLREQPLMRALGKGLPRPDSAKGRALAVRAVHWNTCPMRRKFPGRLDRCLCVRDGRGRIIGATNDPASCGEELN